MKPRHAALRPAGVLAAVAALTVLVACTQASQRAPTASGAAPADAVVVTSFNFPESVLLAEIYAQALEHAGIPVRRDLDLGPRELVQPALREGLADVVPEYLGTALTSVLPAAAVDRGDSTAVLAALRRALVPLHLVALQPAAASDQNGFAVTRSTADRFALRTLTDLAEVRPPLILGGPSECPSRPYCLAGLQRVYGLRVKEFMPFDDPAQRAAALAEGVIDVAVTFTTDGALASGRLVLLRDDRRLQPTEQVVPVVSDRAVQRYGAQLSAALDGVSAALDTEGLRFLNWRISVAGKDIPAEARAWLDRHGLLARR